MRNGKGSKRREDSDDDTYRENYVNVRRPADFARTKQGRHIINAPSWTKFRVPHDGLWEKKRIDNELD